MKFCILATNENVEAVRTTAYANIPELKRHSLLNYPLSESGENPPTHWFCTFDTSEETIEKLLSLKNLSEMEASDPRKFLKDRNLKLIKP